MFYSSDPTCEKEPEHSGSPAAKAAYVDSCEANVRLTESIKQTTERIYLMKPFFELSDMS